ncbi:MAG: acyl-CoA/acyl-ACP dehydrogenase [Dehalococcoidia bacterium]|jgi:isovaleryl-CoA dehydrogenase|nr:acyl-CoA/acyl-ACP dehydrogenase [Dehalococcoidia bacterium]
MTYFPLTKHQLDWQERARDIAARELAHRADETDRLGRFPTESLDALRKEGLWGLRVPKEYGGMGEDMVTTCVIVEELSKKCPSTAMCYKMHLEGAEIISMIPTPYQVEHYVEPLAKGEIFTAAAGGESAGAGDDWTPVNTVSAVTKVPGGYQLDGVRKAYVTSAGHCTHYEFRTRVGEDTPQTNGTKLFFKEDQVEWEILAPWDGLGMRGNSSSPVKFTGFVPDEGLLGSEHTIYPDTDKFLRPMLGLTYAAAYLGIASGAYEIALEEMPREYRSGARRIDNIIYQRRMAEMSTQIEAARTLMFSTALWFDQNRGNNDLPYLQAKVNCSEAATRVTQDLMTCFTGTAFARRLPLERYFRDARAGLVMGMANDVAYQNMIPHLFPGK